MLFSLHPCYLTDPCDSIKSVYEVQVVITEVGVFLKGRFHMLELTA